MKISEHTIRHFLHSYSNDITHIGVAHTDFHTYHCSPAQLARREEAARKQCGFFVRCFSQALYGAKALRKPLEFSPLILTTIEGAHGTAIKSHTIHFNFAFGKLPNALSVAELRQVFAHCWIDKAKLSPKKLYFEAANADSVPRWLNYITKEAEHGNLETWDFVNTRIPYVALTAD